MHVRDMHRDVVRPGRPLWFLSIGFWLRYSYLEGEVEAEMPMRPPPLKEGLLMVLL